MKPSNDIIVIEYEVADPTVGMAALMCSFNMAGHKLIKIERNLEKAFVTYQKQ